MHVDAPSPAPSYDAICAAAAHSREETMSDVHILVIDLAKRSFQVRATDRGAVPFNCTVSRAKLMQMLDAHEPPIMAVEAYATSYYWGHVAQSARPRCSPG